jgi:hypothetical protein
VTRDEMLEKLGIGDADFRDYLNKVSAFRNSLNTNQLALFHRTLPSVSQLAAVFGSDAAESDIEGLFAEAPAVHGIAALAWLAPGPPPPPPPPPGGDEEAGS